MATSGGFKWDESLSAVSSLTSNQYHIVRSTGNNNCDLCTGSSGGASGPFGVLQNDPAAGEEATVRILGISKVSAGGSVSIGDWVTCTTGGQALTATTTGQRVIGKANSASTAAGQIIEVVMTGHLFYTAGATA